MIELIKVLNRMDDARRRPGSNRVQGILAFKPSSKSTGIATANNYPIWFPSYFALKFKIFLVDKVGNISKSLLRSQIPKVWSAPIGEWLGGSVITVLKSDKHGAVVGPDHEWIHFCVGRRASPLSTQVKKNGSGLFVKKLTVSPVALRVSQFAIRRGFKVVDVVCKRFFVKILHQNFLEILASTHYNSCTQSQSD